MWLKVLSWDILHYPVEEEEPPEVAWIIDIDFLNTDGPDRVGKGFNRDYIKRKLLEPNQTQLIRFRTLDEDRNLYYAGWLLDDEGALSQEAALAYSTWDAGATDIQVWRNNTWVMEIG